MASTMSMLLFPFVMYSSCNLIMYLILDLLDQTMILSYHSLSHSNHVIVEKNQMKSWESNVVDSSVPKP